MHQIKHIVVLMMENHSFDNLLGMVPYQVRGRQNVDGLTVRRGRVTNVNPAPRRTGPRPPRELPVPGARCARARRGTPATQSYDGGRNDGFVRASGPIAMWFWDKRDLPFTYSLAQHFPIGERYFCSTLCQTYPNRRFLFSGTASGLIATNLRADPQDPRRQRHDLGPARRPPHRLRRLLPGPPQLGDHPRHGQQTGRAARGSTSSTSSTATSRRASCPRSRSSTPTTARPPRRTRRTSRSASSSSPRSCAR